MDSISWQEFTRVELRVGTSDRGGAFPEARKPAYKLTVDFGPVIDLPPKRLGILQSD